MICFKTSENNDNVGNIHIRPGLEIFLEIIKEFYEIIIFTVGTREYANIILDSIEKKMAQNILMEDYIENMLLK